MYLSPENDSLSEVYFLKAIETNLQTENLLWLTFNYINISRLYLETGALDNGYSYLSKSLKLAEENEFSRLLPWIYNFFGKYYYSIKDYNKSLDYTHLGLNASIEQVNRMQERVALIQLKDVYDAMNDFENAFKYSELIVAVNDSINKHNKLRELDLLEMRYKFEEEQKARKLEQALLKAKHYRKELIYVLVILGSGITLLTFVFLFISQRNRTRRKTLEQKNTLLEKEKLAKDLELRNKELTSNAMSLMKKNEVLSDIAGQLMDLRASAVKDETKFAIKKIVKELQKSKDSEIWKEFDMRFKQVHNDFYNKLIERFPDLTPTEQRLCAFLRLNMTSKEISELTGQRTGTIEMARSKVRKKLGIAHDQTTLITFLAKI